MQNPTYYKDYFEIKPEHSSVMTRDKINEKPEKWLDFYPHDTFLNIVLNLLTQFDRGNRSLWITGAYGTGKSHAALVLQKLFMDDESRVEMWFSNRKHILNDNVVEGIRKWRKKSILVVYEYGSDNISTPSQFMMRIQRAIRKACKDNDYIIPTMCHDEKLLARIQEQEVHFFKKRDEIQNKLAHLTNDIKTYVQLKTRCDKDASDLLRDVEIVLEYDSVYLPFDADQLLNWVKEIIKINSIGKIVFLWDEFSSYIDKNSRELKAFEMMAEPKALQCGFHFVPITHMGINAYLADGANSAKKANDRYHFCQLEIPPNTVFMLGEDAFRIKDPSWSDEKEVLWSGVSFLVQNYVIGKMPEGVIAKDFKRILPLHPMAAFLLMHLSTTVGSNVRSFFDYLMNTTEQSEFQKFITEGGPSIPDRQYLMVDYLWHYFIERDDLGQDSHIYEIRSEFYSKKNHLQKNTSEERVFKAVLLYSLMSKMGKGGGNALLMPTVENLIRAFEGDGAVINVKSILENLKERNCFSIFNGQIMPFQSSTVIDVSIFRSRFTSLVADHTCNEIKRKIDSYGDKLRFVIQGADGDTINPSDIKHKEDYGEGTPLGGNKILICNLFAKDHKGKLEIPGKVKKLVKQFSHLRIIFLTFPDITFCDTNKNHWETFIELIARASPNLTTDQGTKKSYESRSKEIIDQWNQRITNPTVHINAYVANPQLEGEPYVFDTTWGGLKELILLQLGNWFEYNIDRDSGYPVSAFDGKATGLSAWALAGIVNNPSSKFGTLIKNLEKNRITFETNWFEQNHTHRLTKIHDFCLRRLDYAVGKGTQFSLRKLYIELQRAPYGFERNGFSAFILGFVLKGWLNKKLQWTNGQMTNPLDENTLAEMIGDVVGDNGNNLLKAEKRICKLSEEEKSFTKHVSQLFDMPYDSSATPESVLSSLGEHISLRTGGVPLWMLPPYLCFIETETVQEEICEVINKLCEVLPKSSKSILLRTESIKVIGDKLKKTEGLFEAIQKYLNPEKFQEVFHTYVDQREPELTTLAKNVYDNRGAYYQSISEKFRQDASWLWNEGDVSGVLTDVKSQYEVIRETQQLFGNMPYMSFNEALERLSKLLYNENKISVSALSSKYPFVSQLGRLVCNVKLQGNELKELVVLLIQHNKIIRELFLDPVKTRQIDFLKCLFRDSGKTITDIEWKLILQNLTNRAKSEEHIFNQNAWSEIETILIDSEGTKLREVWNLETSSSSPSSWSEKTGMPAEILFDDSFVVRDVLSIIETPERYTTSQIKDARIIIETKLIPFEIELDLSDRFIKRFLSSRYLILDISAVSLRDYLFQKLGNKPNEWRDSSEYEHVISAFVKINYDTTLRPLIEERVQALDDATAKTTLLNLIKKSPEVGIELFE